jgi:hypothetical protein
MLKVAKVYIAQDGTRFYIHGKKQRPSSNGFDFIGENLRSGLITYFNYKGAHAVRTTDWQLKVDPYKWCGVLHDGTFGEEGFVTANKVGNYDGYLRMENDNPSSIVFVTRSGLEKTYV